MQVLITVQTNRLGRTLSPPQMADVSRAAGLAAKTPRGVERFEVSSVQARRVASHALRAGSAVTCTTGESPTVWPRTVSVGMRSE